MSTRSKMTMSFAGVWFIIVAFFTLLSVAGGEALIGSFWWLFLLSLPSSLLSALHNFRPQMHFVVVALLGLAQWVLIGFVLGHMITKLSRRTSV